MIHANILVSGADLGFPERGLHPRPRRLGTHIAPPSILWAAPLGERVLGEGVALLPPHHPKPKIMAVIVVT